MSKCRKKRQVKPKCLGINFVQSLKASRSNWEAPVPYDSSTTSTNPLTAYLLANTWEPLDIQDDVKSRVINSTERDLNDGLRELHRKRKLSANEQKVQAEKTIQEMIQIYLALKERGSFFDSRTAPLYQETSFLFQVIEFAVKYRIESALCVEYAVGECMLFDPEFYTGHYFLKCLFNYTDKCRLDDAKYFLDKTKNLRFDVTLDVTWYKRVEPGERQRRSHTQSEVDDVITYESLLWLNVPFKSRLTHVTDNDEYDDERFYKDNYGKDDDDDFWEYDDGGFYRYETPLTVVMSVSHIPEMVVPAELVLLLLRYGATCNLVFEKDCNPCRSALPVNYCVYALAYHVREDLLNAACNAADFEVVSTDPHIVRWMRALRYVLRAEPWLKIEYTRLFDWYDDTVGMAPYDADQETPQDPMKLDIRLKQHFLPSCLTEPVPSLLHQCRYKIRSVLLKNGQVPDGVSQLFIPTLLCRFVDLLDD